MWLEVGTMAELTKRKRIVVEHDERQILVGVHDGQLFAFDNLCIHRERELSKGMILRGRLVCPGHQWAFDLGSGWEAVKGECQPTYAVEQRGDTVFVDADSRRTVDGPPDSPALSTAD